MKESAFVETAQPWDMEALLGTTPTIAPSAQHEGVFLFPVV